MEFPNFIPHPSHTTGLVSSTAEHRRCLTRRLFASRESAERRLDNLPRCRTKCFIFHLYGTREPWYRAGKFH